MTGRFLDLDEIVDRIHEQGVWAYVEQTDGGCATIYAGAWHSVPHGNYGRTMYAVVAGPGTYGRGERPSVGHMHEFFIGADDQGVASIGYGRVSTRDQNPDAQRDQLTVAGVESGLVVGCARVIWDRGGFYSRSLSALFAPRSATLTVPSRPAASATAAVMPIGVHGMGVGRIRSAVATDPARKLMPRTAM